MATTSTIAAIRDLSSVRAADVLSVGGKAANLGELMTQLMLGVDRDPEICAERFDAGDDAVTWAIERIVGSSHAAGLTVSRCGQAPSDDPTFAEFLVDIGRDSISVNPDVIDGVRAAVASAEQRLLLAAARGGRR